MESSGRNGDDVERPAGDGPDSVRLPLERSLEGRFVVRSSSHPPTDQTSAIDSSGVHSRPQAGPVEPAAAREGDRGRPGRSTPAERPRTRKELRQGGQYLAEVRARCDTPRALPGTRISDRPGREPWMDGASSAAQQALPTLAALTAASVATPATDEVPANVDEVTRRVRRPPSPVPERGQASAVDVRIPWRVLVTAGAIVMLFLLSVWLFG